MTMYPVSRQKKVYQIAVRTNGYMHERLQELAAQNHCSMNYYINTMFRLFIAQLEKDRIQSEMEEKNEVQGN